MPTPRPLSWDDLQLLGSARNGASAPTLTAYRGIEQWEFSAATTNQLSGSIELPHTYSEGTDIIPHAHFTTASTNASGGGVVLGIEYTICNPVDGATESAPVTLTATKTIPAVNSQYKQFSIDLGTISGAGLKVSSLIRYRIFRLGGDGADTFPATIFPQSFALHYRSDSDGSTGQNTKF